MELLQYWEVIRRRWWLPVAFALAALVASSYVALRGASAYRTDMRLAISTLPTVDRAQANFYDPVYYANLSSEYLADDLSEILRTEAFAADLSQELAYQSSPAIIANSTRTKKTHRLIDVTVYTMTSEEGSEIGAAFERILNDPVRVQRYLRAMDAYQGQVAIVNRPVTGPGSTPAGLALEVGLRTLAGLAIGIALALLLNYLDQTVRSRQEVEELLGLSVLGEVPRHKQAAA